MTRRCLIRREDGEGVPDDLWRYHLLLKDQLPVAEARPIGVPLQALVWIDVILGGAVLASHAWGLARIPKPSMLPGRGSTMDSYRGILHDALGGSWAICGHRVGPSHRSDGFG